MNDKTKWTEAEIRAIVRDELKYRQGMAESFESDDNSSFFGSIKKRFDETERRSKNRIAELEDECERYRERAERAERELNDYSRKIRESEEKADKYKNDAKKLKAELEEYSNSFGKPMSCITRFAGSGKRTERYSADSSGQTMRSASYTQ